MGRIYVTPCFRKMLKFCADQDDSLYEAKINKINVDTTNCI